jgi:MFS family permease
MVVTQIVSIVFYRFWGRLSDRFSNKSVLQVTIPLFLLGLILWTFTTMPDVHILTLPLVFVIHVLMGVSSAGVNLASTNMGLKLAPRGAATHYLASWGLVNSLAAAFAPLMGGALGDLLANATLSINLSWTNLGFEFVIPAFKLKGLDFLFMISFLIGLYSLYRLASVRETGEVDEKILIDTILSDARRGVRSLSTVEGFRTHLMAPLSHVWHVLRRAEPEGGADETESQPAGT